MKTNFKFITFRINTNLFLCRLIILLFIFSSTEQCYAQKNAVRNLAKNAVVKSNTEKIGINAENVDLYNELALDYLYIDPSKSYNYAKEACIWSIDLGYNYGTANSMINIGYLFILTQNDFDKAMTCFKKAYKIGKLLKSEIEVKQLLANIFYGLGLINFKNHDYAIAIDDYKQAIILYRLAGLHNNVSKCYHNLGYLYKKVGDDKMSKFCYHKEIVNSKRIANNTLNTENKDRDSNTINITIEKIDN